MIATFKQSFSLSNPTVLQSVFQTINVSEILTIQFLLQIAPEQEINQIEV